jgi:hypothetical protein
MTLICNTPLEKPTACSSIDILDFRFSRTSVRLYINSIEAVYNCMIGDQVDVRFEDTYIVPFQVISLISPYTVELMNTTKKCVNWLINRYNVVFEG